MKHSLPRPCDCCGRPWTVADVARVAHTSPAKVQEWLDGTLLRGDSYDDPYSLRVDRISAAVEDLDAGRRAGEPDEALP